jgi:alcohol dehydrogenase (cytochrome c)
MTRGHHLLRTALFAGTLLVAVCPVSAADVTPDRLVNADREPQNWLMNHRTYNGQRFSPLARINTSNVKDLKLAYAVPLGGGAGNEFNEATPLAEDGFLYITDSWGVLYKIDGTGGVAGGSAGAAACDAGDWDSQHRRRTAGREHFFCVS